MILRVYDSATCRFMDIRASQVVVCNDSGTPLVVALEWGTERSQWIATCRQPEELKKALMAIGLPDQPPDVQTLDRKLVTRR